MRIGLGVTALVRNVAAGRHDGIGAYSSALRMELRRAFPMHSFSDAAFEAGEVWYRRPSRRYELNALASATLGRRFDPLHLFSEEFDLFHALDHYIPNMTIPVVATVHDVGPLSHPHLWPQKLRRWKNLLYAAKCRFPTLIIAVSRFTADELCRCVGLERRSIEVIYEGVGKHIVEESQCSLDWAHMGEKYGLKPGYVVYCGTISRKKNLSTLLKAHAGLDCRTSARHPLVIIGSVAGKEEVSDVIALIRRGERAGVVRWLGALPDAEAAKVLHHGELFAFPSLHEGFGLPVLEAFQLGVPVLTSNVASLPEISGGSAVLVNPTDCAQLARALEQLLRDSAWRRELSERGKERAAEFSWEECARLTVGAYERVVAR